MDDDTFTRQSADLTHKCPTCGLAVSATQSSCPVDGTPIAQHLPGFVLDGKYEFIELIGAGGMGVIYKARQIILNRPVAVKMMHSHMISDKALMRFQREGKAGSALSHPNITVVLDFAISQHGQPYMVMDFEVGQTLSDMIEAKGALNPTFVIDAMIQISQGLAHAHERNVLHRDLKPSNMMVVQRIDEPPLIKILDFGIAKILDTGESRAKTITRTGETMGSPPYMSPEQSVSSNIDQRSDLYSLGCVMFECLTGTPPFLAENVFNIMMAHANQDPPTLKAATLGTEFPGELERIVKKSLSKKPEDRYQSAKEFEADLQRFKSGHSSAPTIEKKRSKVKLIAIAAASLLALAAFGYFSAVILPNALSKNSSPDKSIAGDTNKIASDGNEVAKEGTAKVVPAIGSTEDTAQSMDQAIDDSEGLEGVLQYLREHRDHTEIKLGNKDIADQDLAPLADCEGCQRLDLPGNNITGPGMKYVAGLKSLTAMVLAKNKLGNIALPPLAGLTNLRQLDLSFNRDLGGETFSSFGKKNKLVDLVLEGTKITDEGLKALTKFGSILSLNLAYDPVSENGIKSICSIKDLAALNLTKTNLTKAELDYISKHRPTLATLYIRGTDIGDSSVPDLLKFQNLRQLDVSGTKMTGAGILKLAALPNLEKLWCGDCDAFEAVGQLHSLKPNLLVTEGARTHTDSEIPVEEESPAKAAATN